MTTSCTDTFIILIALLYLMHLPMMLRKIKHRNRVQSAISPGSAVIIVQHLQQNKGIHSELMDKFCKELHLDTKLLMTSSLAPATFSSFLKSRRTQRILLLPWTAEDEIELFMSGFSEPNILGYRVQTPCSFAVKLFLPLTDHDLYPQGEALKVASSRSRYWHSIAPLFNSNPSFILSFAAGIVKLSDFTKKNESH